MLGGMDKRGLSEEIRALGRPTAERESPVHAAHRVAAFVVKRWEAAGIKGYQLDGMRRPLPASKDLAHDVTQAKATSPSGTTLFRCRLCGSSPSKLPPSGVCAGEMLCFAGPEIAALLVRGVLYAPREPGGLPLPLPLVEPAVPA